MINKVILIGNLGNDPEIRHLENGAAVAKMSVATNENYRDKAGEWQTQTEWHDVIMWRQMAERAQQQLKKGSQVYVEGKLTHRSWEDKDGNKRKTTEVVANSFRIMGRREGSGNSNYFPSEEPARAASAPPPSGAQASSPASSGGNEDGPVVADDDLPF